MSELLKKVIAAAAQEIESAAGIVGLEKVLEVIPSLAFVDPETTFTLYREFKPMRDMIEFTIYYREPGRDRFRITAEVDCQAIDSIQDIGTHNFRITEWIRG